MGRNKAPDQQLDATSAAGLARLKAEEAEIDAGIDSISKSLDNLANIASTIKDEVSGQMMYLMSYISVRVLYHGCRLCLEMVINAL